MTGSVGGPARLGRATANSPGGQDWLTTRVPGRLTLTSSVVARTASHVQVAWLLVSNLQDFQNHPDHQDHQTTHQAIHEAIVDTVSDGEPMAVLRKRPESGGPHPGVVLFHDGPGMRAATHAFARRLASYGYDVAVPDLYHRHGRMIGFDPEDIAADPTARDKISAMLFSLTDEGIQNDLDATLQVLEAERPAGSLSRLGCAGFCLGARAVFRTMTRRPEQFVAGAMWHPSFLVDNAEDSPHLCVNQLAGSLYAGFGEDDSIMSIASMQPFITAVSALGDRAVIDIHPDADHGYTWPGAPSYNEAAAERSWTQTLTLFACELQPHAN